MSNKSETAVALKTEGGGQTELMVSPFAVSDAQAQTYRASITAAKSAPSDQFTNITPEYWEAKRGDVKIMVFLGWKETVKVNEKTGEEERRFMAVFYDGDRQIVAGQLALLEAMFGRPLNATYRIECVEATAGKAKRFTVEQFNG